MNAEATKNYARLEVFLPITGWLAFTVSGWMVAAGTNSAGALAWAGLSGLIGWIGGAVLIHPAAAVAVGELQDRMIKAPAETRVLLAIHESDTSFGEGMRLELPVSADKLRLAAAAVVDAEYKFSYALLSGRGKALARSEFERLRDALIGRGLLVPRNERATNQGYYLVGRGRALFKALASHSPTGAEFALRAFNSLGK